MRLLAIDPGYAKAGEGCACALFVNDTLAAIWFERALSGKLPADSLRFEPGFLYELDAVLVEQPQADGRSLAVPPGVLIKLAWEGAKLAGLYAGAFNARLVDPTVAAWKGSEAKPLQHKRLWAVLDQDEREILGGSATELAIRKACEKGALKRWAPGAYYPKSWLTHNLLDAVALGAKHIGRLV